MREQIKKHPIYKGNRNKSLTSRQGDHFMHCVRGGGVTGKLYPAKMNQKQAIYKIFTKSGQVFSPLLWMS